MRFCSFLCPHSDNSQAQHAACQAVNGVYCKILKDMVEKGTICPVPDERYDKALPVAEKPPR